MDYTYNIQKVDFFSDQIEEMGKINLQSTIKVFQEFPFEAQMKKANQMEMTSCAPTITYKCSDNRRLGIWTQDNKGFFMYYENGGEQYAEFYLPNSYDENPEGYVVEEFIEQFFENTIEQSINLKTPNTGNIGSKRNNWFIYFPFSYGNSSFNAVENGADKRTEDKVTYSFDKTTKFGYFLLSMFPLAISLFLV